MNRTAIGCWLLLAMAGATGHAQKMPADLSLRNLVPERWHEKASSIKIVTFKKNLRFGHDLSLDPAVLSRQLDEIKAQGFQAIEIFAPADGLVAANGLDTKNHYRIDPSLGNMDDFRRAVRLAHLRRLAVIAFINLGYFSVEAPDWLLACKQKKAGKGGDRVDWFLWSDKPDAPPPVTQEDIYLTPAVRERAKAYWGWQYSQEAGSYFWARWMTSGKDRKVVPLPQTDWASEGWRNEAERIVRFWMDTGLDGMLIDAPLCYPNQTWAHNRKHITQVMASYGNVLMDPEGGRDVAWITEAGYNCLHDYGLNYEVDTYNWQNEGVILQSLRTGNPAAIEAHLRHRDRIVNVGGVIYSGSLRLNSDPARRHLQQAVLAGIGDMLVYGKQAGNPDAEETLLLQLKARQPALHPVAARRRLLTNADDKFYAFLKTARDGSDRVLAVYNFQPTPQTVKVDLSVVETAGLVDLVSGEWVPRKDLFQPVALELPALGYRFFSVAPSPLFTDKF